MTRRKRPPMLRDLLRDTLGPLDGQRIPGGCTCPGAYQTVRPETAGAWRITVHHDNACPVLIAHMKGAAR